MEPFRGKSKHDHLGIKPPSDADAAIRRVDGWIFVCKKCS